MSCRMKKELSDKARKAMSDGGRKASKTAKSRAGKEGFKAMVRQVAREILAEEKQA